MTIKKVKKLNEGSKFGYLNMMEEDLEEVIRILERASHNIPGGLDEDTTEEVYKLVQSMERQMIELRRSMMNESVDVKKESDTKSTYKCPHCEETFKAPIVESRTNMECPKCEGKVVLEIREHVEELDESLQGAINDFLSDENHNEKYYNQIYAICDELGVPVYHRIMQSISDGALNKMKKELSGVTNPDAVKDILKKHDIIPNNA